MGGAYPSILDQLDRGAPVSLTSLGGGCIADAAVATFSDGSRVFIKRSAVGASMFEREAEGLRALADARAIRIPGVLAVSAEALVLEFIEQGKKSGDFFADFGRRFASLHRCRAPLCGFAHDNFIGSTPQANTPVHGAWKKTGEGSGEDWPEFFIERRLRFQTELAAENGHGDDLTKLLDKAGAFIGNLLAAAIEPPSLLHGDLWSGNYLVDKHGEACLIDPAVYFGHREADLAMTRLFGGFSADFYQSYEVAFPLANGWPDRLPIYQLYHLLNHLNLFGSAYYGRCHDILRSLAQR